MKRYFIDGDSLLIVDAGSVRVAVEVCMGTSPAVIEVPSVVTDAHVDTPPNRHRGRKKALGKVGKFGDKTDLVKKLIRDGVKPREILRQTGVPVSVIYVLKSKMKKSDDSEDPRPVEERGPIDSGASDDELASKIRTMWGEGGMPSPSVCLELAISMGRFNRIVQKYKIIRNG